MKRIAIVSIGYMWFPCESGPSRFYQIAQTFADRGYEVECITTSFQHFKKTPRDKELILAQGYPFKITFIDAPAYRKNIDVRRVYSNYVASRNLEKYLVRHITKYNVVYVSIPANNVSAMVTSLCRVHNIPVIVDIEDLWPEAMSMVVKNKVLRSTFFYPFLRDAEISYRNAYAVVGTSEDYTARAFNKRPRNIPAETIYVGCNLKDFDAGAMKHSKDTSKPEDEFWVTYAGSISTSYDIKTLINAGNELRENNVHIHILGNGSLKESLEAYSSNFPNIHFHGYTPYPVMAAFLTKSDIVVNSFIKGAPQSIVNKVGDYLASGKPMINTLENPVFCNLITSNIIGINIEPGNVHAMRNAILRLQSCPALRIQMGENARALAEKDFDRAISYPRIVALSDALIE